MAHPYASQVKASQKRRMNALHAKTGKAWGSVNVDLKNSYKNAGTQREYTIGGATAKPRADRYAKGGKVKRGNTTNVIIAQPKPAMDAARPVPVPIPVRPPMRPPMGAPAAPPPGVPAGAPPMGLPVVGGPPPGPPQGLPLGARPPGLKKGGAVKKAGGGFLTQTPGETYRGYPHSPTTGVDDAVSARKAGGGVKKHAKGGSVAEESKDHEAKESKAVEDSEAGDDDDDDGAKKARGGGVEGGAGSALGRLRESAAAAKVPAKTES